VPAAGACYIEPVPFLRVLVLAFAIANASGLMDVMLASDCGAECAETDCDEGCPPVCPTCHCVVRSPLAVTATPVCGEPPRIARLAPFAEGERDPTSPDPREILHVPRALA
jgi:hypothetical protein